MSDDYYKVLGVSKDASQDDIQKAYRKLARKYHPDVNKEAGAKESFQKVQEAFDNLGNPEKRKVYDQFGVSRDQMGSGGGQGPFKWSFGGGNPGAGPFRSGGGAGGAGGFNIDDILKMFGGGGMGGGMHGMEGMGDAGFGDDYFGAGTARRPTRGADHEQDLTIPFTLAVEGGKADLTFRRSVGSKAETVTVTIPPGMEDGQKIRLGGLGNSGRDGGKPGNLIITIHVTEHSFFTRKGQNLYLTLPVTLQEAAFGGKVDVPTLKGSVTVTVPAGSSSGTKLRIRGCGVPKNPKAKSPADEDGKDGDLFAELSVVLPKTWTDEDKKILAKLSSPEEPIRGDLRW